MHENISSIIVDVEGVLQKSTGDYERTEKTPEDDSDDPSKLIHEHDLKKVVGKLDQYFGDLSDENQRQSAREKIKEESPEIIAKLLHVLRSLKTHYSQIEASGESLRIDRYIHLIRTHEPFVMTNDELYKWDYQRIWARLTQTDKIDLLRRIAKIDSAKNQKLLAFMILKDLKNIYGEGLNDIVNLDTLTYVWGLAMYLKRLGDPNLQHYVDEFEQLKLRQLK